jgi:uncharacterized protein YcbK (DUF882 family)
MSKRFCIARRGFLRFGATALACSAASPVLAAVPGIKGLRALAFHNLHTDERLHVAYWQNGTYNRAAMAKINHILRDHYSGDVYPMDVRLMDLLHNLQGKLHHEGTIEIISGYRSARTNMMLAQYSDGVAKRSYHTKGMAIDIRMPGTSLPKVYHTALAMHRGGVGYYPDSQFVHVDVGPTRTW